MRDSLDRFYTPETTSAHCISLIQDIDDYDLIVEPSAGSGSFSRQIPNCLAYDIAPAAEGVITQNFLELDTLPEHKKLLIIGNPPFGKRSTLAKDFIRHSIKLGADTIAFILPDTFVKYTNQSMFDKKWRLVEIASTPDNFFILDDDEIHIPCKFFIWTTLENYKPGVNLRDYKQTPAKEFVFLSRGDNSADIVLNGNSAKVRKLSEVTNSKAEHYIKINEGYDKEEIIAKLKGINFNLVSSVNGGVAWIGQNDILKAWKELKD